MEPRVDLLMGLQGLTPPCNSSAESVYGVLGEQDRQRKQREQSPREKTWEMRRE